MPIKATPETTRAALREFARGGEEATFRKVFEALGGLVFACALRRAGDAGMVEEVTQNPALVILSLEGIILDTFTLTFTLESSLRMGFGADLGFAID